MDIIKFVTQIAVKKPFYRNILELNPLAYFPLWDASGTVAQDMSGNGYNGTYSATGITLAQPGIGDGKTSAAFSSGSLNIYNVGWRGAFAASQAGSILISLKVSASSVWTDGAIREGVFVKADANNFIGIYRTATNGQMKIEYKAGGTSDTITVNGLSSVDWITWLLTWNLAANEVWLYQMGAALAPTTCQGTFVGNLINTNTMIGANNATPVYPWSGNIAHVAFWDRTLTPAEGRKSFFASRPYSGGYAPTLWALRAAAPLTTPTYDLSGQTVHPGVIYNAAGLNGYKYWMVMTPYTDSDNTVERPSILASNDGTTWVVPEGLTNPIYDVTACSDPDLVVDDTGKMWVVFRKNIVPNDDIKICSSTNGVTWSESATLFSPVYGTALSPALIYDGTQWLMFTINDISDPNVIERRTCATIDGTWSEPVVCSANVPTGLPLWHLDVVRSGNRLLTIICLNSTVLIYGFSDDWGLTWTLDERPFMLTATGVWDAALYRTTFIKNDDGTLSLWYSASTAGVWHTGYTIGHVVRPGNT